MFRILKAEFAYNIFLLSVLIVITPIIRVFQEFGVLSDIEFLVPMFGFLVLNGVMQRLWVEKRITRLSQLPVTPADVGIFRALLSLIPFLTIIAINIILNIALGFTAYADHKTVLTVASFYINFYFTALILLDLFSNYPKKGAIKPKMKIKIIAGLVILGIALLIFFILSESGVISPVYLEFLLDVIPFFATPTGVVLAFLLSVILVYVSVETYTRRKVYVGF